MTTLVTLSLAVPNADAARLLADALTGVGLNVDTNPTKWFGAVRPVSLQAYGAPTGDVDLALAPLRAETDYEVLSRTEEQG